MEVRLLANHSLPDAFAALEFKRIDSSGYLIAEATAQSRGFRAHLAEVYFFRSDIERFTADLRTALAGYSSGDIKLESMSPGECVLRISALKPDGEGSLEASLGRVHLATGEWAWDRTTVAFPLSPGGWDDVLADLDAVLRMTPDDEGQPT